jgi:predicted GH43/DUF377 family glycosyl hydrolase
LALLHRPDYQVSASNERLVTHLPQGITDARPGIWIAYVSLDAVLQDIRALTHSHTTELLAQPGQPWEARKTGAGTPPILTEQGWLLFCHGVSDMPKAEVTQGKAVCYQVGTMLLARDDPRHMLARSYAPVLRPEGPTETDGAVPGVIFPTAVDVRGQRLDLYYGAADSRIAVATAHVSLPICQAPSALPCAGATTVAR